MTLKDNSPIFKGREPLLLSFFIFFAIFIVMIAVTSLKQGFNRVVRRGVGYISAPGQISSFPLLGEQIVLRAVSIVSGQCCEQ